MGTPSQGTVGNDSISGEVGQDGRGVAIGKGIEQDDHRAYGGSVYIVGHDGDEEKMASAGYILALLEQIDRRTGRLEQTMLQTAMDQATSRSERVALQAEIREIRDMVQKIQEERDRETKDTAVRLGRVQLVVVLILLVAAVALLAFILYAMIAGNNAGPIAALLGYEAWRTWIAVGRLR